MAAILLGAALAPAAAQLPAEAAEDFRTALDHFHASRYGPALELLDSLESRFPSNADVHHLHAIVLDLSGRPEDANRQFARAVQLSPDSIDMRSNYGANLMRLGRDEDAAAQFREVLQRYPGHATANFNLGAIHFQRGEFEQALPFLQAAYESQPDLYENGYQLALCRFLLEDFAGADRVLGRLQAPERAEFLLLAALNEQALGRSDRVASVLDELRPLWEEQSGVRAHILPLLLHRRLYREAAPLLEVDDTAEARLALARARLALGQHQQALAAARRSLELEERAETHALLGDLLESLDQPVEAVRHYQRAAELDPREEHLFALGYEFLSHWNWETAEQVLEGAVRLHPGSWRLWLGLGAARLGTNRSEEAAAAFLEAIRISPQPMAYNLLAVAFEQVPSREALEAFEAFHEARPGDPRAAYYRTMARFRIAQLEGGVIGDLGGATRHLAEVADGQGGFFEADALLGEIYSATLQWPRAVESLRRAARSRPEDVQARYRLGLALQRIGRSEEAREELETYRRLKAEQDQSVSERMAATKQFVIELKKP